MLKLHEIHEKRAKLIDAGKAIETRAKTEKRETLTADETADLDRISSDLEALNGEERRARIFEAAERQAEGETVGAAGGSRELRGYSVAKAVQEAATGRLTGIEAEYHQEQARGREVRGVMVPTEMLLGAERRGQTVGTNTEGGYLVPTTQTALADRYRPALKTESMGATVLRNLSGFLDVPKLTASGSVSWVAENGEPSRSSVGFGKVSIAPHTVSGEYQVSRRLMVQSAQSIEDLLRRDLGFLLAQALDAAAINGSGASNQPLGVLKTSGVEKVTTATAFSDTTSDLIAALELDDVSGSRAFLTNPTVMNACRKIKDTQSHVIPTTELFHGERVEVTTQVPKNIGSGSDKSALIFGQWAELLIGYWSAVDILVNPYHPDVASSGGSLIHAFLDADVAVRHTEAFAFAEI
jgi:HK97 family phage major capsid protein